LKPFQVFKNFTRLERLIFIAAFLLFSIAAVFLFIRLVEEKTTTVPVAGGDYTEGVVGQPSFINTILAGNDADRDLIKLAFSNLLDLSESHKINDDGKSWTVRLKENLFWTDGEPITSDDVIFTIKTIQDPDSNSPSLANWQGIAAERVSEKEIKFTLPISYAFFENVLQELYPAPKHIFGNIPAANLRLSAYNFEPVGSGKFKFVAAEKQRDGFITEYQFERNGNYAGQKTYLDRFNVKFFSNENDLVDAFNSGKLSGFGGIEPDKLEKIKINYQIRSLRMPRYYAVFINQNNSPALKDVNVRLALNYATDRKRIIQDVFGNRAISANGPITPGTEGFDANVNPEENFSLEKAEKILNASGWQLMNGDIREKAVDKNQTEQLKFQLIVPDIQFLKKTAELLKEDWAKIGAELNLQVLSLSEINQNAIRTRNYEMILFGNNIGKSPDLFSFWHSSERFYPGLNLSLYENKTVDGLINSIRKDFNEGRRAQKLATLQSMIMEDQPAVFLYSPNYLYAAKNGLSGFDEKYIPTASDRFQNVEKWYIKTARVFK